MLVTNQYMFFSLSSGTRFLVSRTDCDILVPQAAARVRTRAHSFERDAMAASTSSSVESQPKLTRRAHRAKSSDTPIAASTCDGRTLPDEQAAPELTITPSRSRAITAVSAATPGMAKFEVFPS